MRLSNFLSSNRGKSLFLPAHGRGSALPEDLKKLLKRRPGIWDLPELPDLGESIAGDGAISISQKNIAMDFGIDRCWYGVNGATSLLQAAILSMVRPGEKLLMPRNVHRSIINTCIFGGITPLLFDLPFLEDRGHFAPPNINWLKRVFDEASSSSIDFAAVVLVNPTYHGYSSDLGPLVNLIHEKGLPVLIDEAHGAHFFCSLENLLPDSGLKVGADLVVHSLHKSATGLAQTAVLWSQGDLIDPQVIERSITWLQTSSPSSLLLASCEASLKAWRTNKGQRGLTNLLNSAKELYEALSKKGIPLLKNHDPLKLILHSSSQGISGFSADNWFLNKRIIAELPEPGTLTFCLGFSNHRGLTKSLQNKWNELLDSEIKRMDLVPFASPQFPLIYTPEIPCSLACRANSQLVSLEDSIGLVSADMVCPYPPGIPMLIPGEKLTPTLVNWMIVQRDIWPNQIPLKIKVLI